MGQFDLAGKTAFITGGASGLGRAAALALAEAGADLVIADRDGEGLDRVAAELDSIGRKTASIQMDVTEEGDWAAALAETIARCGRIDVLINNAGVELVRSIEQTTLAEWRHLMAVNLDGVFLGIRAGIGAMTGGGSIINISSVAGIVGFNRQAAYCASKGGVRLLTKAAAVECAESGTGIRVNSIHPGVIDTPMFRNFTANMDAETATAAKARFAALHPVGHIGAPRDVAACVVFLASDAAKFITGAELVVDGGLTAR